MVNSGRAATHTIQDAADYIAARRKAHSGWRIILIKSLPSQEGLAGNQSLDTIDAVFLSNYRAMGANAVVYVRQPGS